jgi:hypothetical protein
VSAAKVWTDEDRLLGRVPWACRACGFECPATDWDEQKLHAYTCKARAEAAKRAAEAEDKPRGNCPKCLGRGKINAFRNRDNGDCYQCRGTGSVGRAGR